MHTLKTSNKFKGVMFMNAEVKGVIAIDDGGSSTCVVTRNNEEKFLSVKGLYGERTLTKVNSKYDFIVEYKGEKYVMGSLAKYDCALPLEMHTESKQNLFYDLSTLVAIHQYGFLTNNVVLSVPIKMHNKEEKRGRIERLKGSHTIKVNGVARTFLIQDVKVAPECASAYWIHEPRGMNRWLDIGSRTVNYATTINIDDEPLRFIDNGSGTFFGMGLEALETKYDAKGLADYICGRLIKVWKTDDKVYLFGGGALDETLVNYIKKYFPNAEVIGSPQMSNARGMYRLGVAAYGSY